MAPRHADPKRVGIRRKGTGWQAAVSRGASGPPLLRQFPLDTPLSVIQDWRHDTKASLRLTRKQRATMGMFEADARRYLKAVAAMPTIDQRTREIDRWIAEFGQTPRADITSSDIRAARDRWLTEGRSAGDKRPVSPATVNKRLRALSNLWTVLDGRRAPNPVREVPEAQEPSNRVRALDYTTIERILQALPDRGRPIKGQDRSTVSHSKARLRVLAYTGWPSGVLKQLRREDVDLERGVAHLPARRKGQGAPAVTVPLVPEAIVALTAFDALKLWGPFDARALNRSWKRAAKVCDIPEIRTYDLRHSFLTAIGQASKDERAVQAIAQHRDIRTTRRYTEGSVPGRIDAALQAARATIGPKPGS